MKVNKSVFAIVGFLLIVGVAYWAVNYFAPPLQHNGSMEHQPLTNEKLNVQTEDSQSEDINTQQLINNQVGQEQKEQANSTSNIGNENSQENKDSQKPDVATTPFEDLTTQSSAANKTKMDILSAEEQKREKLNMIREGLRKIATGDPKDVDFNKLDALLVELQEIGDENGIVGGVNIPQLRKIIAQSQKIIETSQNKGLLPGEDKNQKLKQEVETLQDLQQGIVVKHE
ncbi:hypothetical protein [Thiomicrorhabdus sp.]|uniref:hypothetical protein n=1 Tax=Thiomicrorhabdus sp. TaxID=2039724 RepID=UPI002AA6A0FE|nr:hypothetical protein [Thiomicrorhabdus sp.]